MKKWEVGVRFFFLVLMDVDLCIWGLLNILFDSEFLFDFLEVWSSVLVKDFNRLWGLFLFDLFVILLRLRIFGYIVCIKIWVDMVSMILICDWYYCYLISLKYWIVW